MESTIKDVRGRVHIPIEADLIATGTQRHSAYCVIAEAIRRALPHVTAVSVDLQTIRWSDKTKGLRYIWLTPVNGQQFIVDYDQGHRERLNPLTLILRHVQILKMRTDAERRKNRGVGSGNGEGSKKRPGPKLKVKGGSKDLFVEVTGGKPMRHNPASPSRFRVFGARHLVP